MKIISKENAERLIWWIGLPILTIVSVFGPYWVWHLVYGISPFWRITVFSGAMFDISWYLPMMGAVISGLNYGGYLHWFASAIKTLSSIIPGANVPELWFVSRWISTTVSVWVGAWCLQKWSGLSVRDARLFSFGFWLALILPLGMRPGVYSWYLPLGLFGFTAAWLVWESLSSNRVIRAVIFTICALVSTWIYLWFWIFAAVWLAVIWALWIFRTSRRVMYSLVAVSAGIFCLSAFPLARWILQPSNLVKYETYERLGLAFTRMPFVANPFIAVICWVALLFVLGRMFPVSGRLARRIEGLQIAWVSLLLAWQFTPFMGVFFQNDHLRTPVVILAWFSLALVWNMREEEELRPLPFWSNALLWVVLVAAMIFVVRILASGYVFHDEFLNVLHMTQWLTILCVGSWIIFRTNGNRFFKPRASLYWILFLAALIGIPAWVHIHRVELPRIPGTLSKIPVIDWMRANVPANDAVCTDPETAAFLGIHVERMFHPLAMTRYLPMSNKDNLNIILQIASAYDVKSVGEMKSFKRFVRQDRSNSCAQYLRQASILRGFGMAEEDIQNAIGCPTAILNQELEKMSAMIENRTLDEAAFSAVCPWVVVSVSKREFWHFPSTYGTITFPDQTIIRSASLPL
ncbi:MAG: hypothetical protein AAB386_04870 [Patescibacteria group bacterium]